MLKIVGVSPFQLVDKRVCIFLRPHQDKMNVVGHQDECKNEDGVIGSDGRDIIHPHLEILFLPEPKAVLQMIGGDEPQSDIIFHRLSFRGVGPFRRQKYIEKS